MLCDKVCWAGPTSVVMCLRQIANPRSERVRDCFVFLSERLPISSPRENSGPVAKRRSPKIRTNHRRGLQQIPSEPAPQDRAQRAPIRSHGLSFGPPMRAVLPSADSATDVPWRAPPAAPEPTSFSPCCDQIPRLRANELLALLRPDTTTAREHPRPLRPPPADDRGVAVGGQRDGHALTERHS
jgi:hypothetical protein